MQLPLFKPKATTWSGPRYDILYSSARRIAIDVETRDEHLKELGPGTHRGAYVVGLAVAIDNGPSSYYPLRHDGGGNVDSPEQVLDWLKGELDSFEGEVVGANLSYDLAFLRKEGITFPKCKGFRDIQIAEALLYEYHSSYKLDAIAKNRLGEGKIEGLLNEALLSYGLDKSGIWRLPAEYVGEYAEGDVTIPLQIYKQQEEEIKRQELNQIWKLESDLVPVFVEMNARGMPIDLDGIDKAREIFSKNEHEVIAEITSMTTVNLTNDLMKPERVAAALGAEDITPPLTAKTKKPSITKEYLEELSTKSKVAAKILRARRLNKARTTFLDSFEKHQVNGRIHCNYNQLRTVTGRLSSSHPNIQQVPIRDKVIGPIIRSLFITEPGCRFGRFDYKQQEPRLTIHYASLIPYKSAQILAERLSQDVGLDLYNILRESAPQTERDDIKTIFLGRCYNMGDDTLAAKLNLKSKKETDKVIGKFEEIVPFLRKMNNLCQYKAKKNGHIKTILGRRCRFPDGEYVHKALNRLIQGSAADQTKQALYNLSQVGYIMPLQVHDELDTPDIASEAEANEIKETMEGTLKLSVPSMVDVSLANNWGECK